MAACAIKIVLWVTTQSLANLLPLTLNPTQKGRRFGLANSQNIAQTDQL